MQTFREWLNENEQRNKVIDFRNFFESELSESVINKIKNLYYIKDPNKIVDEFKKIFDIADNIKISKINIGCATNPKTKEIKYSTLNSLIHELIHYLQLKAGVAEDIYKFPDFTDCAILKYILQPLELNTWAISLAAELLRKDISFQTAGRNKRLKHCIYLLTHNMNCGVQKKYKDKLLKLSKQYMLIVKSLSKDINEHYTKYTSDAFIHII
jgi:hypothetical protein